MLGGAGAVFYVSPVLASATLVLIYFIVIVVLVLRPRGLFGGAEA